MNKTNKISKILIDPRNYKEPASFSVSDQQFIVQLKRFIKNFGDIYNLCVDIFSPVFVSLKARRSLQRILKKNGVDKIIINLGSGPGTLYGRKDIINVDITNYDYVDIVADGSALPIKNLSVDVVINVAVLEHVKSPSDIVREMHRILKRNGWVVCYVPFMQPFHAAPEDYQRWTKSGLRYLFKDFRKYEIIVGAGPTSGLLWTLQEWIATALSFNSRLLHDLVFICVMLLTWPLKYIDLIFDSYVTAENSASGFMIIAQK